MFFLPSWLAFGILVPAVSAQQAGSFVQVGQTIASAMMMFVGGPDKVYIIDKAEANPTQINGHSVYAAVWDIAARTATPMDVQTNAFCAAGMHLPNASYAVFGGNGAVGPDGQRNDPGATPAYDPTYKIYDGTRAIRIISPCDGDPNQPPCSWYDQPNGLQMLKQRWYPGAEALANGTVVLIGGFTSGGYINRQLPNIDPTFEGGQAEPTYETFPPSATPPQVMKFLTQTSGLNSYALTFLMPSGKMFVQANYSTILWDYDNNVEYPLPDMPGQIVRVYPASGATAMLPLTPFNGYNPTILFCGGQIFAADNDWGDYGYPHIDTWTIPASSDCHRITPEPADGSSPVYVQDDNLPVGRTMGQFIALPDGTMLLLNGATNGTAGYAMQTSTTPGSQMPFGISLASGPVYQPVIYNPNAPAGSRWSSAGLGSSTIPRMYHSSALLLPDGSVMVAGSNPNADANLTTVFSTTYTAEYFYPPYFSATTRPVPQNVPTTLSYGGNPFDITVPPSSYTGHPDDAAGNTTVWLIRQGFTTHAMNLGQRSMQLNNTFSVQSDGTIIIHTAQPPPFPNLFQPGPAFLFVTISGIPSNGTYLILGNGQVGPQSTSPASVLPTSVRSSDGKPNPSPSGSGSGAPSTTNNGTKTNGASPPVSHYCAGYSPVLLLALLLTLVLS